MSSSPADESVCTWMPTIWGKAKVSCSQPSKVSLSSLHSLQAQPEHCHSPSLRCGVDTWPEARAFVQLQQEPMLQQMHLQALHLQAASAAHPPQHFQIQSVLPPQDL